MFLKSKEFKWLMVGLVTLIIVVATIPLAIWVTHTQTAQGENSRRRCDESTVKHTAHIVTIEDEKVTPEHTSAKLCDTLIIVNKDAKDRLMAFGQHDHHVSYDGTSEKFLRQGQSFTVTLITPGDYKFHDHEDDDVGGTFSVQDQTHAQLNP
jgi:hypothetical protein